jgi:alpha-L-rhamnosidase
VTLRSAGGTTALSLHNVFIRSRQALGQDLTHFHCDNPVLNWVWPVALRTLLVSTDESYSDCPWRERGSYIGDAYVNITLNQILSGDHRTARRALRIFAQAQLPDGQLACCAPSWLRLPHEDFSLIWLLALHDFWSSTAETSVVDELWPVVQKIWKSSRWESHSSGLWDATKNRVFIDWGTIRTEREGLGNAALNVFRAGAAKACAALALALGRAAEAEEFLAEAETVESLLFQHLWNDAEGRFNPSLEGNTPALHANTLALAFGLGEKKAQMRILAYLEPRVRKNFAKGIQDGYGNGHLELYFLNYALPAFAAHGRPDLSELLINDHYGFLQKIGDDTFPETFCRVQQAVGSRCHSWSGAGAIYAARYVLGIRQLVAGEPDKLVFDPVTDGIKQASGRIAHPRGWIECRWEAINGRLRSEITVPPGVEVRKGLGIRNSSKTAAVQGGLVG